MNHTNNTATDYVISPTALFCSHCNIGFATRWLTASPEINTHTKIEADLHIVYEDPAIRASLIAICPSCNYSDWVTSFRPCGLKPETLPEAKAIEPAKKFVLAVQSGRKKNLHPFDLAFIALNGAWCSREAGQPDQIWLELAAFEFNKGRQEEQFPYYMMGEIKRQLKDFAAATEEFTQALHEHNVPDYLIEHQLERAKSQDFQPTLLPPHMIQNLFSLTSDNSNVA